MLLDKIHNATFAAVDRKLHDRWMRLTVEERFRTCGGLYQAEKAILERLAPLHYSKKDLLEFVCYHMHGMTPEELVRHVPDNIP